MLNNKIIDINQAKKKFFDLPVAKQIKALQAKRNCIYGQKLSGVIEKHQSSISGIDKKELKTMLNTIHEARLFLRLLPNTLEKTNLIKQIQLLDVLLEEQKLNNDLVKKLLDVIIDDIQKYPADTMLELSIQISSKTKQKLHFTIPQEEKSLITKINNLNSIKTNSLSDLTKYIIYGLRHDMQKSIKHVFQEKNDAVEILYNTYRENCYATITNDQQQIDFLLRNHIQKTENPTHRRKLQNAALTDSRNDQNANSTQELYAKLNNAFYKLTENIKLFISIKETILNIKEYNKEILKNKRSDIANKIYASRNSKIRDLSNYLSFITNNSNKSIINDFTTLTIVYLSYIPNVFGFLANIENELQHANTQKDIEAIFTKYTQQLLNAVQATKQQKTA